MFASVSFTATGTESLNVEDALAKEVMIQLDGTFVGTVQLQVSVDGTNWVAIQLAPVGGGAAVTNLTAAGAWIANNLGVIRAARQARLECTAFTSGQIDVFVNTVREG